MTPDQATVVTMRLLLEGHSRADITEKLAAEKVKDPRAAITEAMLQFAALSQEPRATRLGFCQEMARELLRRLLEVGDLAGAVNALKEYARLGDVYTEAKGTKKPPAKPGKPEPAEGDELTDLLKLVKAER